MSVDKYVLDEHVRVAAVVEIAANVSNRFSVHYVDIFLFSKKLSGCNEAGLMLLLRRLLYLQWPSHSDRCSESSSSSPRGGRIIFLLFNLNIALSTIQLGQALPPCSSLSCKDRGFDGLMAERSKVFVNAVLLAPRIVFFFGRGVVAVVPAKS